jgi:hypothetical protein
MSLRRVPNRVRPPRSLARSLTTTAAGEISRFCAIRRDETHYGFQLHLPAAFRSCALIEYDDDDDDCGCKLAKNVD